MFGICFYPANCIYHPLAIDASFLVGSGLRNLCFLATSKFTIQFFFVPKERILFQNTVMVQFFVVYLYFVICKMFYHSLSFVMLIIILSYRSTRESTPCSFIRDSNDSITPGSSTRRTIVSNSFQRIMPSAQEIEEFFARHAQEQQRLFSDKYTYLNHNFTHKHLTLLTKGEILIRDNECRYNFDITNEKPLQGRYEWVRVQP